MSAWLASTAHWALSPLSVWLQAAQCLQGRVSLDLRGTWGVILLCGDWSVRRQLVYVTNYLPGYRLCDPPPGPSLPQGWITKGHFRVLVDLSQPQPLERGGSGLHSRSLAPTPALSLGHPCTIEKGGVCQFDIAQIYHTCPHLPF